MASSSAPFQSVGVGRPASPSVECTSGQMASAWAANTCVRTAAFLVPLWLVGLLLWRAQMWREGPPGNNAVAQWPRQGAAKCCGRSAVLAAVRQGDRLDAALAQQQDEEDSRVWLRAAQ